MFLAFGIIIDALLLWFLLLIVAKIDASKNIMPLIAVFFASAVCSITVRLVLTLWLSATQTVAFWASFTAYFLVVYLGLSWFFDLEARAKLIIMSALVVLHVILAFIL